MIHENISSYKTVICPMLLLIGFAYYGCRYTKIADKSATLTADTLDVCGTSVLTFYDSTNLVYLLTLKGDTVYSTQDYYHSAEVVDFNLDGCPDVKINVNGNANLTEMLVFDKSTSTYWKLQQSFLPKYLANTDLWYEFEWAGCGNDRWVSTLYKIRDFESFKIAEMYGVTCAGEKKGVFVSRISPEGKEQLLEEYSGLDAWEHGGHDFIDDYWKKNHQKFD